MTLEEKKLVKRMAADANVKLNIFYSDYRLDKFKASGRAYHKENVVELFQENLTDGHNSAERVMTHELTHIENYRYLVSKYGEDIADELWDTLELVPYFARFFEETARAVQNKYLTVAETNALFDTFIVSEEIPGSDGELYHHINTWLIQNHWETQVDGAIQALETKTGISREDWSMIGANEFGIYADINGTQYGASLSCVTPRAWGWHTVLQPEKSLKLTSVDISGWIDKFKTRFIPIMY